MTDQGVGALLRLSLLGAAMFTSSWFAIQNNGAPVLKNNLNFEVAAAASGGGIEKEVKDIDDICSLGSPLPSPYFENIKFLTDTLSATGHEWFATGGHSLNALRVGSPIVNLSNIVGPKATDNDFDLTMISKSFEDWNLTRYELCNKINNNANYSLFCDPDRNDLGIPRLFIWKLGLQSYHMLPGIRSSYSEILPLYEYNDTHMQSPTFKHKFNYPLRSNILPLRKIKYGQLLDGMNVRNTVGGKYNFIDNYEGRYGYGCHDIVFSHYLWNDHNISGKQLLLQNETKENPQNFIRNIESQMFQCSKNLHYTGYASFYQCYDESI